MTIRTALLSLSALAVYSFLLAGCSEPETSSAEQQAQEPEILYWVAPMDSDFRRPEPGKSPMGMDLVPVYANQGADQDRGVVTISAAIENNISVRSAVVERGKLHYKLRASGELQVAEHNRWHIHSRTAGWIEELAVQYPGQTIKAGAPLYAIYSPELVDAKEDFVRAIRNNEPAQVEAARLRLNALQVDNRVLQELQRSPRSPVAQKTWYFASQDTVLETLSITQGMYVKPEQTLLSLVSHELLWLLVELPASQSLPLAAMWNQDIEVESQDVPGRFWSARLDYFYPQLNPQLRTQTLRLAIDNQNLALHPGMWMQINSKIERPQQVLRIAKEAVIRTHRGARVVMALGQGRFKSVAVELGRSDDEYFELLSGLKAGDRVAISAQFLLDSESMKESDLQRIHSQQ